MNIVSAREMTRDARENGYAVPAFNTNGATYDLTRAALESAREMESPLIVQVYEPNAGYRGFGYFVHQVRYLCEELDVGVPVAIQLDHGHSFDSVVRAIRAGFTSVMIDASHEPIDVNAEITRKVVEVARPLGVSVEAEIGYVAGNEPAQTEQVGRVPVPQSPTQPAPRTAPEEAIDFVKRVDVDLLAVAVGTTHGVYESQTGMDFDLVRSLRSAVDVPLVQHGTGGISLEDLSRLKDAGMAKINFGEVFRYDYIRHFLDITDNAEHLWHPWRIMEQTKDRVKATMIDLIRALGSDGKA